MNAIIRGSEIVKIAQIYRFGSGKERFKICADAKHSLNLKRYCGRRGFRGPFGAFPVELFRCA